MFIIDIFFAVGFEVTPFQTEASRTARSQKIKKKSIVHMANMTKEFTF